MEIQKPKSNPLTQDLVRLITIVPRQTILLSDTFQMRGSLIIGKRLGYTFYSYPQESFPWIWVREVEPAVRGNGKIKAVCRFANEGKLRHKSYVIISKILSEVYIS